MMDISIWDLLDIHNLERVLSERLALKTAQLAQSIKSGKHDFIHGPLGKEWDKKLRKNNDIEELNTLRELLTTVKEAKKAGMLCCGSYQCEVDNLVDEKIAKYENEFHNFEEKSDFTKNVTLLYTFIDLFENFYKPNETKALFRAVKEMKKLNEDIKNKQV